MGTVELYPEANGVWNVTELKEMDSLLLIKKKKKKLAFSLGMEKNI